MLKIRKKPVRLFLGDFSAVLTAILFALCVPPLAPWWIALFGMLFAIVIAKHLYGGLGYNMFNPAMVGYVVVLISFPQAMTAWLPPLSIAQDGLGLSATVVTIFTGNPPSPLSWDAITQATPLDTLRTSIASGQMISEPANPLYSVTLAAWAGNGSPTGTHWAASGCCGAALSTGMFRPQ